MASRSALWNAGQRAVRARSASAHAADAGSKLEDAADEQRGVVVVTASLLAEQTVRAPLGRCFHRVHHHATVGGGTRLGDVGPLEHIEEGWTGKARCCRRGQGEIEPVVRRYGQRRSHPS